MSYKRISPIPVIEGGTGTVSTPSTNAVMYFNGSTYVGLANGTTGQILTATTSSAPSWGAAPAGGIITLDGDSGSATGSTVTIVGSTNVITTTGSGATLTLTTPNFNFPGNNNWFIGYQAGTATANGNNVSLGTSSLGALNGGQNNIGIGRDAGLGLVGGGNNIAIGYGALAIGEGGENIAIGYSALPGNGGGVVRRNICIGSQAGSSFTSTESDNIEIGYHIGSNGDNHTIRLGGGTGSGNFQQNLAFISGIQTASLGGTSQGVVIIDNNDQLASSQSPTITGSWITSGGNLSLPTTSSTVGQITINSVPYLHGFGTSNAFVGPNAGNFTLSTASLNIGIGSTSLAGLTTGNNNTGIGYRTGYQITTGSRNVLLGYNVGSAYTGAESDNIIIGTDTTGITGESHVLRIGNATGSGTDQIAKSFIAGIRGVTTDAVDALPVLISSTGQLGTVSSSIRYKEDVEDMGDASSEILNLRPVIFNYKVRPDRVETGLIAEEVLGIMPELVVYNKDGEVESVKYHELPTLLLNELQKAIKRIEFLETEILERRRQ